MRVEHKSLFLVIVAAASVGAAAIARGEEAAKANDETAAVRKASHEYSAALSRGDVKAVGNMWTPEADYIDATGQKFNMREMLSRQQATPRKNPEAAKPADTAAAETTLRFIRPDVAIEDGISDSGLSNDAAAGRFTAIWVKRDGHWQLDGLRESAITSSPAKEHLLALGWLLGEWVGMTDRGEILVSSHWSDDGHFIIREFAEVVGDERSICATQRIGWDAAAGKIKCWTFDSQGATGEGVWRHEGNRWIVETSLAMPDGKKATNVATFSPGEMGRFVWESLPTTLADEDVRPRRIEFKRAADK